MNSIKSGWFGKGARAGAHWEETGIPTSGKVAFISMHTMASEEEVWLNRIGHALQPFDQGSEACVHNFGNPITVYKK